MKIFSALGGAFKRLAALVSDLFTTEAGQQNIEKALGLAKLLLPMVERLAEATPTRVDDELIALFKSHGVPEVEKFLAMPIQDRGIALLYAGRFIAAATFPMVPRWLLDSAVQLAVLQIKSAK
jgi:hypothetical protein